MDSQLEIVEIGGVQEYAKPPYIDADREDAQQEQEIVSQAQDEDMPQAEIKDNAAWKIMKTESQKDKVDEKSIAKTVVNDIKGH